MRLYLAFTLMSLIATTPADTIVTDATIYTVDAHVHPAGLVQLDVCDIGMRTLEGNPPLNPKESLGIRKIGSLEVGKSADFAVLDRNILQLGDGGRAAEIAQTKVLETWFQGKRVLKR